MVCGGEDEAGRSTGSKAEDDGGADAAGSDEGMQDDKHDREDGHERMHESCEQQQKEGPEPFAIDAGGDGKKAEGRGKGSRSNVGIHEGKGGAGGRQGKTGGGQVNRAPAGRVGNE